MNTLNKLNDLSNLLSFQNKNKNLEKKMIKENHYQDTKKNYFLI